MRKLLLTTLIFATACAGGAQRMPGESVPAPVVAVRAEEVPAEPAPPVALDVPAAVAYALDANPDLKMAAHRIAAAREDIEVARSAVGAIGRCC